MRLLVRILFRNQGLTNGKNVEEMAMKMAKLRPGVFSLLTTDVQNVKSAQVSFSKEKRIMTERTLYYSIAKFKKILYHCLI